MEKGEEFIVQNFVVVFYVKLQEQKREKFIFDKYLFYNPY